MTKLVGARGYRNFMLWERRLFIPLSEWLTDRIWMKNPTAPKRDGSALTLSGNKVRGPTVPYPIGHAGEHPRSNWSGLAVCPPAIFIGSSSKLSLLAAVI